MPKKRGLMSDLDFLNRRMKQRGVNFDVGVQVCPDIDRERARGSKIKFCHVEKPSLICCATDLAWVRPQTRRGILAHEIGHILLLKRGRVNHTEHEADLEVRNVLGLRIKYDRSGLQRL